MPIGTINSAKELAITYQPLLLAVFTFHDGSILRLASHGLNAADGGYQYGGNDYFPRVLNQDVVATQALSEQGIDITPSVSLKLADADQWLWNNYERTKGFKGAELKLTFVFWNVGLNDFSSDSMTKFVGICDKPSIDDTTITVSAQSRMNMTKVTLPPVRIQKTCAWVFPAIAAQRQDGADDPASQFYLCGYSPDASGGNARGNYQSGTTPYTECDYTKASCEARGMYKQDSLVRITGRFGGIQYTPPTSTVVRNYISGKWEEVTSSSNEAKYGDFVPMIYGTAWVDPLVLNTIPDGNNLKMEVLVCLGEVGYIHEVLVNDVRIPHTFDDTEMSTVPPGVFNATEALKGGWWKAVNRGDRSGAPNTDASYDGKGDPYGSMCVIAITVSRKVADATGSPRVKVLTQGPKVRVYSTPSTYTEAFSDNPAWIILDILTWANWRYEEVDIQSFIDAAGICDASINFKNQFGATATHKRYTASLVLRNRKSASEVIRGLRNASKSLLIPAFDQAGKLQLISKGTLASQQPTPIAGSNYNTPIASKTLNGSAANGYVAYRFDESNIISNDGRPSFTMPSSSIGDAPNRIGFTFQNAENRYSFDTLNVVDAEDVGRSYDEKNGSLPIEGVNTFDQGRRVVATWLAENFRGNARTAANGSPIGDTGGTYYFDFETGPQAVHLRVGQLCSLTWQQRGLTNQLFRLIRIQPSANFETVKIAGQWHNDNWYVDTFGQQDAPKYQSQHRNRLERPAYAWNPHQEQPSTGDSLYGSTEWGMGVAQLYEQAADGTSIAKLLVTGKQPVNQFVASPNPPFVPLQGTTANTGGSLEGGRTVYAAICAKDANGKLSAPSTIVSIDIPAGTSTNTATIPAISWDAGTVGYALFAGRDGMNLSFQSEASGTPASLTLTSISEALWGLPDAEFDRLRFRVKRIIHGGLWGAEIDSVTATTIKIAVASPGFTTNEYAGYDLALVGMRDDTNPVPLAHFRVASNTSDTLTFAGGAPNPVTLGLAVGDAVVMMSKPIVGSDGGGDYIEDAGWESCFFPSGMATDEETGRVLRFVAGTGRGMVCRIKSNTPTRIYIDGRWPVTPDSTSRYVVEEPSWQLISDTASYTNDNPSALVAAVLDVNNYKDQTLLIQALTLDGGDTESLEPASPFRMIYLFGGAGSGGFSGALSLQVDGTVGIGSDLAPRSSLIATTRAQAVKAEVKTAPTGADLTIQILLDTTLWMTLIIPAGSTTILATGAQLAAAADIAAGDNVRLDVTGVGTTFPGSDLNVSIYF